MPLPTTIDGTLAEFPEKNYHCPAWKSSGGNFYVIIPRNPASGSHSIRAYKATDPTDSFTAQDTAGEPDCRVAQSQKSVWTFKDGDNINVIYVRQGALIADEELAFCVFNMATDNWDIVDEQIEKPADKAIAKSCSLTVRSDGDVVALYNGDTDKEMGVDYDRVDVNVRTGGTWGGPTNVAGDGLEAHYRGSVAILGASDKSHFFYKDDTNDDAYHRSFSSADVLGTQHSIDTTTSTSDHIFMSGVYFDDGGTEKVRCPYGNSTDKASLAKVDDDGSPTLDTDFNDNVIEIINSGFQGSLAVDVKKMHFLYSDTTDLDLYHDENDNDAGWGTDTEEIDAVTINRISANVYDRSGTKLAFVKDDGGTVKYNEKDIAAAPAFPNELFKENVTRIRRKPLPRSIK